MPWSMRINARVTLDNTGENVGAEGRGNAVLPLLMLASVFPLEHFRPISILEGLADSWVVPLGLSICWRRREPTVARTCRNMDELYIEAEELVPFFSFSFLNPYFLSNFN